MERIIIPTILAKDFIDFKNKLNIVNGLKPRPNMIQIDVSDGKFTKAKIFNDPAKLARLKLLPNKSLGGFEAHLMVNDPLKHAKAWIKAGAKSPNSRTSLHYGVKRILFHVEPFLKNPSLTLPLRKGGNPLLPPPLKKGGWGDLWKTINFIKSQNIEVGLCLNPETPIGVIEPFLSHNPSYPPLSLRGGKREVIDAVLILCVNPGKSGQKFQIKNLAKIRALRKKYPRLPIEVDGGVNLNNAKTLFQAGATRLSAASAILNADNPQKSYNDFLKLT